MPKAIFSSQTVTIPEGVTYEVKSRKIKVTGPRGSLTKEFKHLSVDIIPVDASTIRVELWFGTKKDIACVRTVCSHINNLVVGVTRGYKYKMKAAYAHFPINTSISDNGENIEIRNFLGERRVRSVDMLDGVKVERSSVKDEIILTGNDLENVSQSAASIMQSCLVKRKDIRKFLDGIYVSFKGNVVEEE